MEGLKKHWWKALGVLLVGYSYVAGLLVEVPQLPIVEQTIRNVFYHVPMWFAMIIIFLVSVVFSIKHLASASLAVDVRAVEAVNVGFVFGSLGLLTGMIWAKFTWGAFWVNDPKLNGAVVSMLVYLAYAVLRSSVNDRHQKARLSAVYNIFAFVLLIVFIGILPRIADGSLHPGSGGDSPFAVAKMHGRMYLVFWPAVLGWILVGLWLMQLRIAMNDLKNKIK